MDKRSKEDLQLERILIQIARDYHLPLVPPDWQHPGDLQTPLPVFADRMVHYSVLPLVADRQNHTPDTLMHALEDCARWFGHLYDDLVTQLYSTHAGQPLEANFYEADQFLVVVFTGSVAPVIEVLGQEVAPFVIRHHRQPPPSDRELRQLADRILKSLYADPLPSLYETISRRVDSMLTMSLRPLPLHPPAAPAPLHSPALPDSTPPPVHPAERAPSQREAADSLPLLDDAETPDTGPAPTVQDLPPAETASKSNARSRSTLRAPLPYWNIPKGRDEK
ncbi:MAG: hypothetical protein K8J31_30405 [Anaerolineae bacterium]|nr:hypothetical protein [Anaerolineae bacterium]